MHKRLNGAPTEEPIRRAVPVAGRSWRRTLVHDDTRSLWCTCQFGQPKRKYRLRWSAAVRTPGLRRCVMRLIARETQGGGRWSVREALWHTARGELIDPRARRMD